MNAAATIEQFLHYVEKSDLVDAREFREYIERLRAADSLTDSPVLLSRALVRDGFLTYYQSEQLLAGRYKNFYLGGKYKVLERLGSGGMASVYLCEHKIMRRLVALKVLPGVSGDDPDILARFHREARAIGQLSHPNIVGAYDVDHHGKLHFLVMEYVDGINLEEYVQAYGPLEPARAAHYVRQAAEGLQHAHEAGLVHRDIKPANLLVDRAGTVKLLDLGLARFFHDESDGLTRRADRQLVLGTLDYLAPEQVADSHGVDIRADIYGLGSTLYHLLTGQGLFPGATMAQKLAAHQSPRDRSIREQCPGLPEGLAAIIDRMLRKDPNRRYQTPAEAAAALAPWAGEVAPAPPELTKELERLSPAARSTVQKQSAFKTTTLSPSLVLPQATAAPPPATPDGRAPGAGAPSRMTATARGLLDRARDPRARWPVIGAGAALASCLGLLLWWAVLRPRSATSTEAGVAAPPRAGAGTPATSRVNSVGMTLVLVPAGEFAMGSPAAASDAWDAEKPQHRVRISRPFYLGAHEVTVGQFRAFAEATGYRTEAEASGEGGSAWDVEKKDLVSDPARTWRSPTPEASPGDDRPVVQVSWNDAVAFCRWLSSKEGVVYRLPTEAEWEYACRAGTATRWSSGDDPASVDAVGWHDGNSGGALQPAGRKAPNPFGLYDLHGNAREWCADFYGPYPDRPVIDPAGPASGIDRVVRGGSWEWGVEHTRSASREGRPPSFRAGTHGFRVCRPAGDAAPAKATGGPAAAPKGARPAAT